MLVKLFFNQNRTDILRHGCLCSEAMSSFYRARNPTGFRRPWVTRQGINGILRRAIADYKFSTG